MPRSDTVYKPSTVVVASPAAGAETIVAQISGVETLDADSNAIIEWFVALTIGVAGVALTARIRQNSLTGTIVANTGALTGGIAAGNLVTVTVIGNDQPGPVSGINYVGTLQVASATGASGVSNSCITCSVA